MSSIDARHVTTKSAASPAKPAWRVTPVEPTTGRRGPLARLLRRRQPSTFHRCLAVHLYFASPRGGLS
jgi:hypothetical protein